MRKLTSGLLWLLLCFGVAAPAAAKPPRGQRSPIELQRARFSNIKGMSVENHDGEKLGTVRDFVIDLQTGEMLYALVSPASFLGLHPGARIIPAQRLSSATAKRGVLALDLNIASLRNAPRFNKGQLRLLNDPKTAAQISAFYKRSSRTVAGLSPETGAQTRLAPTGGQGRKRPVIPVARECWLASEIRGHEMITAQNEPIGKVSDLLLDLSEKKPPLAIVSGSRLFNKEQNFVLPLRGINLGPRGRFIVPEGRADFAQAQPFNEKSWQTEAANGRTIYHYVE